MMSAEQNKKLSEAVPMFPLPNHVVLPHIAMPYRLFEDRYRALGAHLQAQFDAAKDSKQAVPLLVPCLREGWREDYEGEPDFHTQACLCEVLRVEKNERDEYNILIQGAIRCTLEETTSDHPFRLAHITPHPIISDMSDAAVQQSLLNIAPDFMIHMTQLGADGGELKTFLDGSASGDELMQRMAHLLFSDPQFRQEYLESPSVGAQLHYIRLSLGHKENDKNMNN